MPPRLALLGIAIVALVATMALVVIHARAQVGIMAATSWHPRASPSLVMLSLADPAACREGDWVFCVRRGQLGRVRKILGDMAACELRISLRDAAVGDRFSVF
jgi:hypothetical protein